MYSAGCVCGQQENSFGTQRSSWYCSWNAGAVWSSSDSPTPIHGTWAVMSFPFSGCTCNLHPRMLVFGAYTSLRASSDWKLILHFSVLIWNCNNGFLQVVLAFNFSELYSTLTRCLCKRSAIDQEFNIFHLIHLKQFKCFQRVLQVANIKWFTLHLILPCFWQVVANMRGSSPEEVAERILTCTDFPGLQVCGDIFSCLKVIVHFRFLLQL